jgi:hypothetical protein
MPETNFNALRDHLLHGGVAPRHVVRLIAELSDHHEDLELEALRQGCTPESATAQATEGIGTIGMIAEQVLHRPELKCWVHRFPRIARLALPIAYVTMLPLAPLYAGIAHAPALVRWCAGLLLSAVVTAAMLLVMQYSIAMS